MSRLRLRLDVPHLGGDRPAYRVVANIYSTSSDTRGDGVLASETAKRDLLIPAGSEWEQRPEYEDVSLEPGRYLVEVILPSAEAISEEVTIEESATPQELRLRGTESPHEWLSLQHLVGNVREDEKAYKRRLRSLESRSAFNASTELVSVMTPPTNGAGAADVSTLCGLVSRGFFSALPVSVDPDPISPLADSLPLGVPDPPLHIQSSLNPYASDSISEMYVFGNEPMGLYGANLDLPLDYRNLTRFERHYLVVRGAGLPPQYAALPAPWIQVDFSGVAEVEALVRRTTVDPNVPPGTDRGYRISIAVNDTLVGSVIGYLGAGRLPTAARVLTRARQMLFGKAVNPLAAAAGAYVLLVAGEEPEPDRHVYWHQWIKNLMNWFKWLPDGPIQHAWVKLSQKRTEENLSEARASLLEGYRRGLPFYSRGVGILHDGLTLFANDSRAGGNPDEEVEDALATVRRLALRTNMRQPFTTVLL